MEGYKEKVLHGQNDDVNNKHSFDRKMAYCIRPYCRKCFGSEKSKIL